MIAHALPRIQTRALGQRQLSPGLLFGANRRRAIHLGEAVGVSQIEAHGFEPLDQCRGWRGSGHHGPHRVVNAGFHLGGRIDQQILDDRGAAVMRYTRASDAIENGLRLDLAQTDVDPGPRGHRPRKAPAVAMKHGQSPQIDRVLGHVPFENIGHRIHIRAAMGVHHALGFAGRAGGVIQGDRIPLVGHIGQRLARQTFCEQRLIIQRADALAAGHELRIGHVDHQRRRQTLLHRERHGLLHHGRQFRIDQHGLGAAVQQHVGQRLGVEPGVEGVEHQPGHGHAELRFHHGRHIGQHDRHHIPALQAPSHQGRCQPSAALARLRPVALQAAVKDGQALRIKVGGMIQKDQRRERRVVGAIGGEVSVLHIGLLVSTTCCSRRLSQTLRGSLRSLLALCSLRGWLLARRPLQNPLRKRNLDPVLFERMPDGEIDLAAHAQCAVFRVGNPVAHGDVDGAFAKRIEYRARAGALQDARHGLRRLFDQHQRLFNVGVVRHAHGGGEPDVGVVIREVFDAVGDQHFVGHDGVRAPGAAHQGVTGLDVDDLALKSLHSHVVAHAQTAFEQNDKARDVVGCDFLQTQTEADTQGTTKHAEHGEIDAHHLQGGEDGHQQHHRPQQPGEHQTQAGVQRRAHQPRFQQRRDPQRQQQRDGDGRRALEQGPAGKSLTAQGNRQGIERFVNFRQHTCQMQGQRHPQADTDHPHQIVHAAILGKPLPCDRACQTHQQQHQQHRQRQFEQRQFEQQIRAMPHQNQRQQGHRRKSQAVAPGRVKRRLPVGQLAHLLFKRRAQQHTQRHNAQQNADLQPQLLWGLVGKRRDKRRFDQHAQKPEWPE